MNVLNRIGKAVTLQRLFSCLIMVLIGQCVQVSSGQSTNELRKLWQNNRLGYLAENQKDKLFTNADFHQYARIRDEEFAEYLKESWHDYSILPGLSDEPRKNATKRPVFNYSDLSDSPSAHLPFSALIGSSHNLMRSGDMTPRIRKPESEEYTSVHATFLFYGQQINIHYDKLLELSKITSISEDSVSGFWIAFARSNSNHLVDQLMGYRDLLGLGDWGYFQLVKATSNHIFKDNQLSADLLSWALMIRSGFDVRLAYNQNSTAVLFPSENTIYSRQFVIIEQRRFYLDREMNSLLLVTYKHPFPDTDKMIDLRFHQSLNFSGKLLARKFQYKWNNKNYELTLRYNQEALKFYNDYPETEAYIYFEAPLSATFKEDLFGQFHPLLAKMNKPEAVAFLQQFVQREFEYTPINQFNKPDSNRFPEEIVASKLADDRSRAVLFSGLIRILLRLPVVGVQFPGHYSTAICFEEPLEGDFYYLNHEKYIITDPTFLNAPIGAMMPEFAGLVPQIIDLSNSFSKPNEALEIWNLVTKMGAKRGGTGHDVIFDQQGRALITGYFGDKNSCYPFLACFSKGKSLQWIRRLEGDRKAIAYAITKVNDDEIYIAGSFSGKMVIDGQEVQSESDTDLFIAQFNQYGELIWLKNAGIDFSGKEESLSYMVKFDRSGDNISFQMSNEDERNLKIGFGDVSETGLNLIGSRSSTPGMFPLSWSTTQSNISGEVFREYNHLIANKCHPKVASVVAVMELLRGSGAEVTGNQLQALIARYKPAFSINNASLFKAIGQIEMLRNENGIVTLRTVGGKPILINRLKLDNGARFNLSVFGNSDLSIGIISGFQTMINQVLLPVNTLLVDYSSGNLMLNYDFDHTLKTISFETLYFSK